ncbi:hypothetical protein C1I63_08145 [Rathayibacter caricis DSM 15933]|uniref:Uncharacterized protein n=1 Tax=Rathayibacter caricis DSM 15933 TaxID=1328867 RepID=A0A2T4UTJ6_9MICO|nr:hypothetical protein [Rathayibacter caricis]PTL72821.1 hypothetical protein C1I63_08145 [Rathayibacter caricis DSM 15933]
MARRTTNEDPARRGPERHTRSAEQAVDAPRTSPADGWPTAPAQGAPAPAADRPATIRVKKKRRVPRRTRIAKTAKRIGYGLLVAALLAGLAVVVVLIVAPHQLF